MDFTVFVNLKNPMNIKNHRRDRFLSSYKLYQFYARFALIVVLIELLL